jgi:hypothetical protein
VAEPCEHGNEPSGSVECLVLFERAIIAISSTTQLHRPHQFVCLFVCLLEVMTGLIH